MPKNEMYAIDREKHNFLIFRLIDTGWIQIGSIESEDYEKALENKLDSTSHVGSYCAIKEYDFMKGKCDLEVRTTIWKEGNMISAPFKKET